MEETWNTFILKYCVMTNDNQDNCLYRWYCTYRMSLSSAIDLGCKLKPCKLTTISILGIKYPVRYISYLWLDLV